MPMTSSTKNLNIDFAYQCLGINMIRCQLVSIKVYCEKHVWVKKLTDFLYLARVGNAW